MSSASRKSVVAALVRYASSSSRKSGTSRAKPRRSGGASPAAGVSDPTELVPGSPPSSSLQETSSTSDTWVEVRDPKTNQIYYWNKATNETTPLNQVPPVGQGRSLVGLVGMGAGVGLVFALISRLF